jgi:hypothetical protein
LLSGTLNYRSQILVEIEMLESGKSLAKVYHLNRRHSDSNNCRLGLFVSV